MTILNRLLWRDEWSKRPSRWKGVAASAIVWLLIGTLLVIFGRASSSVSYFAFTAVWAIWALYAFRRALQRQQERGDGSPDGWP
jgi:hypothetical protein